MYERWSTLHIAPSERARFWCEATAQAFVAMTPELGKAADFQALMTHRSIDNLCFNEVDAPAHRMMRTAADLQTGGEQYLFLNLDLANQSRIAQRGKQVDAGPGQLLLFNSAEQYDLQLPGGAQLLSLAVPHSALGSAGLDGLAHGPRFLPQRATTMLLAAQMRALSEWRQDLNVSEADCVANMLVGMIRAMLAEDAGSADPAQAQRRLLRGKLQSLVERHYADPAFSAAAAAVEMGIAVRTLHAWLARDSTRFGDELLRYRLERAHAMLRVAASHVSVGEVAARCGFVSASHFATRFRQRYGVAPGTLRAPR